MTVEKLGHRFVSERAVYLADHNWQVATWQEPSADDSLTKIKTWTLLKDAGQSAIHGPNEIRITLELHRTGVMGAWLAKIWRNYRLTLDYIPFLALRRHWSISRYIESNRHTLQLFACRLCFRPSAMARPRHLLCRVARHDDDSSAGDDDSAVPDHAKTRLV